MARNEKFDLSQRQSNWFDSDFFFRAACVSNKKKNRFSCTTRLKTRHKLEKHRKALFSTELHWEIFCCIITSFDYIARIEDGGESIAKIPVRSDPESDPGFVKGQ